MIEKPATNEDVLKEDLYSLRQAIDQFTQDENRPPQSLEDLIKHGYLYQIPTDPFTNSALTWKVVYDDPSATPQDTPATSPTKAPRHKGIIDVHSGSDLIGSDGTRYSTW